jgi:hypothetical protein
MLVCHYGYLGRNERSVFSNTRSSMIVFVLNTKELLCCYISWLGGWWTPVCNSMLLPGNVAAMTSRIALCCHLYSSFRHFCKMAVTTADSSVGKKVNYYTTAVLNPPPPPNSKPVMNNFANLISCIVLQTFLLSSKKWV